MNKPKYNIGDIVYIKDYYYWFWIEVMKEYHRGYFIQPRPKFPAKPACFMGFSESSHWQIHERESVVPYIVSGVRFMPERNEKMRVNFDGRRDLFPFPESVLRRATWFYLIASWENNTSIQISGGYLSYEPGP